MFEQVTVPLYIVVAGTAFGISIGSLVLGGFIRGTLLSRRNHEEQMKYLAESRDEWRSTAERQESVISGFQARSVVLPTAEMAQTLAQQKFVAGGSS